VGKARLFRRKPSKTQQRNATKKPPEPENSGGFFAFQPESNDMFSNA
jgi:hypothetical protein